MTELADCLLVIDMQNGVCQGAGPIDHLDGLVTQINQRLTDYRQANRPIIFIQHNDEELIAGTMPWQIIPTLETAATDINVQKTHADSFFKTTLKTILDQKQVTSLEICGAQTEYCIDTTVKVAHHLGYQLQMQSQMTTTFDNQYLSAAATIQFYEGIWQNRFLILIS
ncbi:cysteine hydrolase family protein [Latilactobacillus fuchuensis]|jgi:nicotinamidase-related amidase|uniref:Hydrolase, isochorismatase/nicotamidase family n=2 Tax=Latilactobacillus fuchuensis TaxID=164393 RepID=A0A2N9DXB9_9LACO|nr:cysteine hydrolase family protein [Latilactobacillus fuchuensis]KRL60459.1 hypothetical protein FC69_GL001296 [Latilactobacillus fuchuensis DSM 14340 = JCM 11249]MCP8857469.1 cysteine hydrolase [Latilactobacillus fuchuensis]SPC39325.1 putative hydrolase, isochorismatase/nicotamidase family [Latilactobacillus fuchuensis]